MARAEFTKPVKRAALKRSGMLCEAVGKWYGLPAGKRCNAPLSAGVEYDHIILDANSKDNSLANAAAVCPKCHRHKTAKHDTPKAAKTLRQQDKANGIRKAKQPIPARPSPPKSAGKHSLPPRIIYR
jgi:5-methylcytosine-specific restriction endonuclease McrA